MDAIATLLSSVAAFLATVAAFLAIVEMRRQRLSSYRPDLAVTGIALDFLARTYGLPRPRRTPSDGESAGSENDDVSLDCFNVGAGPAKEVTGTWLFDLHAFLAQVAEMRTPNGPYAFVQDSDKLRVKCPDSWEAFHSLSSQLKFELPFLLPASGGAEPYQVPVPAAYVQLVALALYLTSLRLSESDPPVVLVGDLPVLRLRLEFSDLGDDSHSVEFQIRPQFTMLTSIGTPPEEGSSIGHTALNVTRLAHPKTAA